MENQPTEPAKEQGTKAKEEKTTPEPETKEIGNPSSPPANVDQLRDIFKRLQPLYPRIVPFADAKGVNRFVSENFAGEKSKVRPADNNFRMFVQSFNSSSRFKVIFVRTGNAAKGNDIGTEFL